MRTLYNDESPVLPIRFVNLKTGMTGDGWSYKEDDYPHTFVLIKKDEKYAMIGGASGHYYNAGDRISLAHDQTHISLGTWIVIGEYKSLDEIQNKINKNAIRGFVFK